MRYNNFYSLACTVVTLGLLLCSSPAYANSCAGACGGPSADGTCYCDDACFEMGDCCGDVCAQCPTLGGCGGGTDPGQGCGSVSYEGCCEGQLLKYCEGGSLQTIDCNQQPSCGWQPDGPYYDCGTAGSPDPSGMSPMACTGGTGPVCGNGVCEAGENNTCPNDCGGGGAICGNGICEAGEAATCPSDCGGGGDPVCGNGVCEAGETTSCPADCAGGGGCGGKECGQDANGNPCGTCPAGFYCSWDGMCVAIDCVPDCEGKSCGDDGCGGSCGECGFDTECTPAGSCVGGATGDDIVGEPGGDGECYPSCEARICGDDGCGGSCGVCPEEYGCTPDGLCEEGFIPEEGEGGEGGGNGGYACPAGQTLLYGKCVAQGDGDGTGGDCSAGGRGSVPALALLLLMILLTCATLRRDQA